MTTTDAGAADAVGTGVPTGPSVADGEAAADGLGDGCSALPPEQAAATMPVSSSKAAALLVEEGFIDSQPFSGLRSRVVESQSQFI